MTLNKEFTVSITNAVPWTRFKWQVCAVFDVSSVLITELLKIDGSGSAQNRSLSPFL